MTLLQNNAEGGTSGTTVTTGNSGGVSGNAFDAVNIGTGAAVTFDNTHAAHGGLSYNVSVGATSANANLQWSTSMGAQTTIWFRAYYYLTANFSVAHRIFECTTSGTLVGSVELSTTGKIIMQNTAAAAVLTSTNSVPLNQWFRVEGFITGSATVGQLSFSLYSTQDSQLALESQTSTATQNTTGSPDTYLFGIIGTTSTGPYWIDEPAISNTGLIGPTNTGPEQIAVQPGYRPRWAPHISRIKRQGAVYPAFINFPVPSNILNQNYDFETGKSPWFGFGNGLSSPATAQTSLHPQHGVFSISLTPDGTHANPGIWSEATIPVSGGQSYTSQAVAYSPQGWNGVQAIIWWNANPNGTSGISSSSGSTINIPAGIPVLITLTATAPAGAQSAQMTFQMVGTPPGTTLMYFDIAALSGPPPAQPLAWKQPGYRPKWAPLLRSMVSRQRVFQPQMPQSNQGVQFPLWTRQQPGPMPKFAANVKAQVQKARFSGNQEWPQANQGGPFPTWNRQAGRSPKWAPPARVTRSRFFGNEEFGQANQGVQFPLFTRQSGRSPKWAPPARVTKSRFFGNQEWPQGPQGIPFPLFTRTWPSYSPKWLPQVSYRRGRIFEPAWPQGNQGAQFPLWTRQRGYSPKWAPLVRQVKRQAAFFGNPVLPQASLGVQFPLWTRQAGRSPKWAPPGRVTRSRFFGNPVLPQSNQGVPFPLWTRQPGFSPKWAPLVRRAKRQGAFFQPAWPQFGQGVQFPLWTRQAGRSPKWSAQVRGVKREGRFFAPGWPQAGQGVQFPLWTRQRSGYAPKWLPHVRRAERQTVFFQPAWPQANQGTKAPLFLRTQPGYAPRWLPHVSSRRGRIFQPGWGQGNQGVPFPLWTRQAGKSPKWSPQAYYRHSRFFMRGWGQVQQPQPAIVLHGTGTLTAYAISAPDLNSLWNIYLAAALNVAKLRQVWREIRATGYQDGTAAPLYLQLYEAENAADQAHENWQAAYKIWYPGPPS